MASPTQSRRLAANLNEYEEAGTGNESFSATVGTTHKASRMMEMEKRVREQLMADKLRSDTPSVFDSSPSRSRTPQNHPPTRTTASASQTDRGGSISPGLQTSPPPSQAVGHSMFQMHTSPGGKIPRSDSNEWTEYTSAPVMVQAVISGHNDNRPPAPMRSTSSVKTSSQVQNTANSSRADVSEFDPITATITGPFARPKS